MYTVAQINSKWWAVMAPDGVVVGSFRDLITAISTAAYCEGGVAKLLQG